LILVKAKPSHPIVAAVVGLFISQVQVSPASWQHTSAPSESWTSVASSADGTRLVAAIGEQGFTFSGSLLLSADSGATWAEALTNAPVRVWSSAATSADGSQLAMGTGGVFSSQIVGLVYTSTDSGLTWSTSDSPVEYWAALAMSADGGRVVAASQRRRDLRSPDHPKSVVARHKL
jgi:hypothetical protein